MKNSTPSARIGGFWCTAGLLALLLGPAAPGRAQVFYLTAGSGGANASTTTTPDDALTRIDYDGNNPVVIASAITGSPFLLALDGGATRAFVYESVPANRSVKVLNMSTGALIRSFAVNGNVTAMRYDAATDGQRNQSGATLDLKGAFVTNGICTATGGTAPQAVGGAREARF